MHCLCYARTYGTINVFGRTINDAYCLAINVIQLHTRFERKIRIFRNRSRRSRNRPRLLIVLRIK